MKLEKPKAAAAAPVPRQRKEYEVGYGRPPKSGQFQPGRSGNPKGRPKGSRNFKTTVTAVMSHKIPLAGAGRKTMSADEVLLRTIYKQGVNGNVKAAAYLFGLWAKYQQGEVAEAPDAALSERGSGNPAEFYRAVR